MRPKFVFALFLLVGLVLGAAFYLKQHWGNTAMPPAGPAMMTQASVPASNTVASSTPPSIQPPPPLPEPLPTPAVVTNGMTPEARQESIEAETEHLQQLSMNDDPASLSAILADLTNSESEVRDAAIEATKQFGSTNAIPILKATAEKTDDTQEKIALLEAVDFLSLPGLTFDGPPVDPTPEQLQAAQQKHAQRQARLHPQTPENQPAPPADQNPPSNSNN